MRTASTTGDGKWGRLLKMTPDRVAFVLTALAAVVVLLTRVRLGGSEDSTAGRLAIPRGLVNTHTTAGVVALLVWCYFLFLNGDSLVGLIGLVLWWITVIAGLLILLRWKPARGRHASAGGSDTWSEGPGLSVLAHVGLAVGAAIWTVLYAMDKLGA